MINKHPKFPQKELEKYEIYQKLPEYQIIYVRYQTAPPKDIQIKNHQYYHDNTHIWNNDHQASSNMKVFGQLFQQKVRGEKRIKILIEQDQKQKQLMDQSRKIWVNQTREEDLQRLQSRKMERIGLQNLSSQQNEVDCDLTTTKPKISHASLLGRTEFLWNQVGKQSQKHVDLLINPKIMAMEEEAIKQISKKIAKDQEVTSMQEDLKLENIHKIRQQHLQKHYQNLDQQQRIGVSPLRGQRFQRIQTAVNKKDDVVEQTLNLLEKQKGAQGFTSRPFTVNSQELQSASFNQMRPQTSNFGGTNQNQSVNRLQLLSKPRNKGSWGFLQKNPLDRSEFKGLYLAHAVEDYDNNFNKTLKSNSTMLKQIEKSRTSVKLNQPKKVLANLQSDIDVQEMNNMFDSFEKKLHMNRID